MAKYIFVNIAGDGHVNPTLPVAQELVARGEEVIYYLTEEFRGAVEATGATFRPYTSSLDQRPPGKFSADDIAANAANIMLARMVNDAAFVLPQIIEEVRAEKPDCVLYDMMSVTGKILARSLHLSAILLRPSYAANEHFNIGQAMARGGQEGPGKSFAEGLMQLNEQLTALCQQFGAEPFNIQEVFAGAELLNIVFIPREFQPQGETFDEHRFVFVGPALSPRLDTSGFPLEKLTGKKVLFISLGTVFNNQAEFFNTCFAAFREEPWLVVLARGKHVDPSALNPIPSNFLVEPYVPQLEILQRASAFITHGGMNSTMESLYYGVPIVAIPQMQEQAMTAQRIEELGLGVMLDKSSIPPENLRQAVERVSNDAALHARVSEMQQHVRNAGGYKKAADAILAFASGRQFPVTPA